MDECWQIGEKGQAQCDGTWYPMSVVKEVGDGKITVHWEDGSGDVRTCGGLRWGGWEGGRAAFDSNVYFYVEGMATLDSNNHLTCCVCVFVYMHVRVSCHQQGDEDVPYGDTKL